MRFDWPAWIFYLQGVLCLIAALVLATGDQRGDWPWIGMAGLLGLLFGLIRTIQERRAARGQG